MKVRVFILTLLLFVITGAYSQRRFSLGVDAGAAFPLGRYASRNTSVYSDSGQAQPGISLSVHATYKLSQTVGVTLVAGGQENKKSLSGLKEDIRQAVPTLTTLAADTKSWQIGKLMGGGTFYIPITDSGRITFIVSATAGVCKARVPGYSYLITYNTGSDIEGAAEGKFSSRNLSWAFCYNLRSGVSVRLNKVLLISGSLSYFDANPKETRYIFYPSGSYGTYQVKHSLSSLIAEAGIEIQL